MTVSVCILIPVYNHHDFIEHTLIRLKEFGYPVILVDDGSSPECHPVLTKLSQKTDHNGQNFYHIQTLVTLPENAGKGVATMKGFKTAHDLGFTHAFQIDADGQHTISDIPCFIKESQAHPTALISGKPVYDASIPKSRLYGRYLTHFWVWVETLSFDIQDSMCGFRVYPLKETLDLMRKTALKRRMDFDIDIMVRLYWSGVDVVFIPTAVTYPTNGVSHFKARDHWMITKLHTQLFFEMLLRFPVLIRRKFEKKYLEKQQYSDAGQWSKLQENGTYFGLKSLLLIYKVFGDLPLRLVLFFVVSFYFAFNKQARSSSQLYLNTLHHFLAEKSPFLYTSSQKPTLKDSFRHFLTFGNAAVDKVIAGLGHYTADDIDFEGYEVYKQYEKKEQGVLMVTSHLGNADICKVIGGQRGKPLTILVHNKHAPQFARIMKEAMNLKDSVTLMEVTDITPDVAMILKDKIDRGENIIITGDRTAINSQNRFSVVPFLGRPTAFTQGPYILAHLLECPVMLLFCMKQGSRYKVYFHHFEDKIHLSRGNRPQQLQDYTHKYAQQLEDHVVNYWPQWYNFYDYWSRN